MFEEESLGFETWKSHLRFKNRVLGQVEYEVDASSAFAQIEGHRTAVVHGRHFWGSRPLVLDSTLPHPATGFTLMICQVEHRGTPIFDALHDHNPVGSTLQEWVGNLEVPFQITLNLRQLLSVVRIPGLVDLTHHDKIDQTQAF